MSETPTKQKRAWMCLICGYVYYEELGLPEEGIPPGTAWEDIPDDWQCPDCGVSKDEFVMAEL
ncbi:MAG TPA: rubredoxin [Mycobacteriales bacterium]|jgi:Rubredoxin